ncbi:hypothetical protein OIU34_34985 [Pararhizobium sp. BT-229]|uniref:hypothetical protein n=1 Tax=Pararhizobium sp. BT-229 TaxID=2986923 RepID=UPI0021F7EF5E|nr:hypothetical protein [Pararhizobium sp. BT-229]MCV9967039.1 hypothetical protein [Pararhizobium sp. BT-229]
MFDFLDSEDMEKLSRAIVRGQFINGAINFMVAVPIFAPNQRMKKDLGSTGTKIGEATDDGWSKQGAASIQIAAPHR